MTNHTQTILVAAPRSSEEAEHIIVMERRHRYNHGLPCGAVALHRYLREQGLLHPMPSVRLIRQILTQYGLTHGRTGWYEGETLDGLPASVQIPDARRKHSSMTAGCHR